MRAILSQRKTIEALGPDDPVKKQILRLRRRLTFNYSYRRVRKDSFAVLQHG
jgi:hypothetical protein